MKGNEALDRKEKSCAYQAQERTNTSITPASRIELKNASYASRKAAREHADKYWQNLASDMQVASSSGNIKGVYDEGIRKAVGPTASKTAPLKTAGGAIVKDKSL